MHMRIKYLIIIFLAVILFPFGVNASENVTLKTDKTVLKKGDSVTVIANIDYDKSLYAFTAGLSYDENVFEKLQTSNFNELNEWSDVVYNKENNKFALLNKSGDVNKHLFMVKLFVKESPVSGKTQISLNNPVASNGSKDIEFSSVSKTLTVLSNKKADSTYSKKEAESDNQTEKVMPIKPIIITSFVLLAILVALLVYVNNKYTAKYKFIKEKRKAINIGIIIAMIALLSFVFAFCFISYHRGDVNNDGKRDYDDAKSINEYLIGITNEKNDTKVSNKSTKSTKNLSNSIQMNNEGQSAGNYSGISQNVLDVNGDGKVTVTDSANVTKHVTEVTYKVQLKKSSTDYYVEKKASVKLNFTATIKPNNVKIKQVYIDGKKYNVTIKNGKYQVVVKAPNKAGIHKYTITKVVLTNGKEVNSKDITFTIDVLKDKPTADVNYTTETQKLVVNLSDKDKALENARVVIAKGKDVSFDAVYKELYEISSGEITNPEDEEQIGDSEIDVEILFDETLDINKLSQTFDDVKLDLGESYSIFIIGSYDLDSKQDSKNHYTNELIYSKNIINGEVKIEPVTNLEELYPEQGEQIAFEFSVNIKPDYLNQNISKVVIDGETKEVTYKDGNYIVHLDASATPGEKNHTITSVILSDDTEMLCQYEFKYDVLKKEPTIENFIYHQREERITFNLNDKDKAVITAKVVITKENSDDVVFEKVLDTNETNFIYQLSLEEGAKYDVKITGIYDLDSNLNNDKNGKQLLYNHQLTVHGVELSYANGSTYYVEKGKEATLKFNATVTPDDNSVVTEVVINGETYKPTHHEDGSYSVNVTAKETAGIEEYKITKVVLGDDEVSRNLSFNVDVLKDKPTIENFYIDESENPKITFNLVDEDNALKTVPGKIEVKDDEDGTKVNESIKKGENTVDLDDLQENLEEGDIYYLNIYISYDLDSDLENEKHDVDNEIIEAHKNQKIRLYRAVLTVAENKNLYLMKEKTAPVAINAKITPIEDEVKIKSFVMADENIIPATYDDNELAIKLTAPNEAGIETYNIKKVVLSNDIEVSAPLAINIDILKDIPYINNLNLNDDNKSISYELVDPDDAFKDGTITIYDKDNSDVKNEKIQDNSTIEYNFEDEEVYNVKAVGNYDLDSKDDINNSFTNKEMSVQTFLIGGAYNFELTDVSITDAVHKDDEVVISFTSTNSRDALVKKVTINDKEYDVVHTSGDNYTVTLKDVDMEPGKHEVTIKSVELDTGKTYTNGSDFNVNNLSYTVLKEAPSITDIELTGNSTDKTVTATAKIKDDNSSLKGLTALLVDSTGKILETKELTLEEIYLKENISVTLSYGKNTDGKYTIKFVADYELGDKYKYNNQNIGEDSIFIENSEIYIDTISFTKNSPYATKGQRNFQISYDVHVGENIKTYNDKKYSRLSGVMVNGTHYVSDGESTSKPLTYKGRIGIVAPTESGVYTLTADRVQLELNQYYDKQNDYYSVPSKAIKIEVLKDVPQIENLKITKEDYENGTVTFEFDVKLDENAKDEDNSFANGTIELNSNKQTIERDKHNEITFENVKKDQTFDLVFKADYDLDTDELNVNGENKNKYTGKEIYKVKYGLFSEDTYENIEITNGKAISEKNNKYFEKNEKIKLYFETKGTSEVAPVKVKIKGHDEEYELTKSKDGFEFTLDGYKTFGEKTIEITDILLENGKTVTLKEPYKFNPEVLKDTPKITDYKYEDKGDNIEVTLKPIDNDGSIVGNAKVVVTNEDGEEVYSGDINKPITFEHNEGALRYYVTVTADYDRDIDVSQDSDNYFSNVTLLEETISFDKQYIELKDINDINLYKSEIKNGEEKIELKDEITKDELSANKDNYFVEINMENMPSIRAKVNKVAEKDGHLILTLDYEYVTKEDSESKYLEIDFGELKGDTVKNETHPNVAFEALLEKLEAGENVTLKQNYDASSISKNGSTYVEAEYTGTLDGNGYTIENLNKPLFNVLKGDVKDLNLKNVTLSNNGHAALANESHNDTVTGVVVDGLTKSSADSGKNGGLIGYAADGTKIEDCGVKNATINVGNEQQNGILVGNLVGSTIKDSYAIGRINAGWNYNAGLAGNVQNNSEITGCYAKVEVNGSTKCDFSCTYGGSKVTLKNNVSLSTGGGNFTNASNKVLDNNYYLTESETTLTGVQNITKDEVNKELFTKANFTLDVWRLNDKTSYDNTPIFKTEKITDLKGADNESFDESKITLYNNLMKLMPFYKADTIIELAETITDEALKTKEISHILPVDSKGDIVTYLTTDNPKKISKLKLVYKDNTKKEYKVRYDNTYDMVATYRITELKLDYNYNHYVVDTKSQIVNDLTNYLKGLDYTDNLDILTSTEDSRIYRDFYNDVTSKELKEFVLKFLSNSNYTNTTNDEEINAYIERAVKKDNNIEKMLYMYNYFRRFYDVEIDGMKLYDYMLFRMDDFDKSLTAKRITDLYFADGNNFRTSGTGTVYKSILSGYTKLDNIAVFVEHLVKSFSDENLDDWTRSQFKGYLVEIPVEENKEEVQYTLWDHFINEDKSYPGRSYDIMLPILTLPKNAAYIISTPVQFVIGAQRSYIENPEDSSQQNLLHKRIASYANRMATYYSTAYKILGDETLFNNIHTLHHDKRYAYDENGAMLYQQVGTNEPFHKNFNEVTNRWQTSDGNAAVAWGDRIDWSAEGLMDGNIDPDLINDLGKEIQEYTYHTFTHETAHNIDARLFLKNHGRRFDAGGEDYADSNLMQSFGPNDIVMNLSVDRTYNVNVTDKDWKVSNETGSNYTPERIDSPNEVWDYYNKVFQTIYVMDYLEAQAFLQLSPEQKAEIGIQVTYPDENTYTDSGNKYRAYMRSGFNQRDVAFWENLKLNSINDLIDNKIMKYAGVYQYGSRGSNSYGGEGINTAHWYQPNNPYGRPDSYALKWIAYEMLGYKGYDNGYIEYNSNIHATEADISKEIDHPEKGTQHITNYKTDNMAIQTISGGQYQNIDEYKKARFEETGEKLKNLNSVINVNEYTQKLYEALVQDSQWASWKMEQLLNAYKKDVNQCLGDYWCSRGISGEVRGYPFSTRVRQEIYYKLKHITNDFQEDIFTGKDQDINFTVDKTKVKDHYEFTPEGQLKNTN